MKKVFARWLVLQACLVPGMGQAGLLDFLDIFRGGGHSPAGIQVTKEDLQKIGRRIWMNECSGTVAGLTSWNQREYFASLGIGHFIWYTKDREGPFEESWPRLIAYYRKMQVPVPLWVAQTEDCPWSSREEFMAAQDSERMRELREFLLQTMDVQTQFIVNRLEEALPKMKEGGVPNRSEGRHLERNFGAVAQTGQGVYALIDYVNFKGEGVKPAERYRGQGWGLAQVLLEMRGRPEGAAAAVEFAEAAKRVLRRRVNHARSLGKDESSWLQGWENRCETYKKPL